jgi:predicted TIM-barrel fold metal-dependent hydrolase
MQVFPARAFPPNNGCARARARIVCLRDDKETELRDGHAIFDLVVHIHNSLRENFNPRTGHISRYTAYHYAKMLKKDVEPVAPIETYFSNPPNPKRIYDRIFGDNSQIDYAMAQVVPSFDAKVEPADVNIQRVYDFVQMDPKRLIFCGGTDPVLRGLGGALRDLDYQIKELGARSIKLYPAHAFGNSWRMDDPKVAYPLYERMLELGVTLVQTHKGDPQGAEALEDLHPRDIHQAALDFPDLNFVVHHLAFPFDDAAIDLGARLPNVYLAMSTWINMITIAPVETAMRMGKMLRWCGPEKVLWGSETPIWPSAQHLLDLCWNFQVPEDLQKGWGFPEITDEDRALMFGGNMLRLLKMDGGRK